MLKVIRNGVIAGQRRRVGDLLDPRLLAHPKKVEILIAARWLAPILDSDVPAPMQAPSVPVKRKRGRPRKHPLPEA